MIETSVVIPAKTIKRIHIDQHRIKANIRDGTNLPVITVQNRGESHKAHSVKIHGDSVIRYENIPLSCGARCWIETTAAVETEVNQ